MTTEATKRFFSSPYFAVAGASQDPAKFGYKILAWYADRDLPVTPINPRSASITLQKSYPQKTLDCVSSIDQLPEPTKTALSVVTPPKVTSELLREAKKLGIPAVWLQPGTYDDEVLEYAKTEFEAGIGGMDGGGGAEGWCVLVDGDENLQAVGKESKL